MNGDAASDALLAGVSLWFAWRLGAARPGFALGLGLIGFAALLGTSSYLGIAAARGPHAFASIVAASAGLPLLAVSSRWPDGITATRMTAAARFALFAGGLGVLLVGILHVALWSQVVPAVAALVLLAAALRSGRWRAMAGAAILAASFALSVLGWSLPPLNGIQQLHVLMSAALALLAAGSGQYGAPNTMRTTPMPDPKR